MFYILYCNGKVNCCIKCLEKLSERKLSLKISEMAPLPEQVSYLRELATNMARGAGPCAVPGGHFIQGPDCASV